jgi:hypothetical protein
MRVSGGLQVAGRAEAPDSKRATWRHMRELWDPIWTEVTVLKGDADPWLAEPRIVENLAGNSFSLLTLENMWRSLLGCIARTPEGSEIGRLVLLLKAAGLTEVPTPTTSPGGTWSQTTPKWSPCDFAGRASMQ